MLRMTFVLALLFGSLGANVCVAGVSEDEGDARVRVLVSGVAELSDGSPAAGATVTVMSHGGSATAEADGSFVIEALVPMSATALSVSALLDRDDRQLIGTATGIGVGGGVADAGVVAMGSLCEPGWSEGLFCFPGILGGTVNAAVLWDDGTGVALYVGGAFRAAGCTDDLNRIAKWDGSTWSALGSGVSGSSLANVSSLVVFDDGSGPALYVGGDFTEAGGISANGIARWDGASWSALGSGVSGSVSALMAFDDGSGASLYVGGFFSNAGGVNIGFGLARWDGAAWSALGSGLNGWVRALAEYDDGSGPALYVGGDLFVDGVAEANWIARWDGSAWSALTGPDGTGLGGCSPFFCDGVFALTVFDDGSGPALYAGGEFTLAGGLSANGVARWDGEQWSTLGSGVDLGAQFSVRALAGFDDGSGPALYVGGDFATIDGMLVNRIARWDGDAWSGLAGPGGAGVFGTPPTPIAFPATVNALTVLDDGAGQALFVGGGFRSAGGIDTFSVAMWGEGGWSGVGGAGMVSSVRALAVFDDGSGPALYAGGEFLSAGSVYVNHIARWEGEDWSALPGPGGIGTNGPVRALAVFDDGTGEALYAGGSFTMAGGLEVNRIARWNGTSWSALVGEGGIGVAGGSPSEVLALEVFDDGAGEGLYAGGTFATAGGVPVNRIARWDGGGWSGLVGPSFVGVNNTVRAFAVVDDAEGAGLYVGGAFTNVGGVAANRVARWSGTAWSPLFGPNANGVNGAVNALAVFDDGDGPVLYAGGEFIVAGGLNASRIARWDGDSWSALASGGGTGVNSTVNALTVFDDGSGPALFVAGEFIFVEDLVVNRIARWDGKHWSALGHGENEGDVPDEGNVGLGNSFANLFTNLSHASALSAFDDGSGPSLFAGGQFLNAGGAASIGMAKWQGCAAEPEPCVGDLTGDGVVDADDLGVLLGAFGVSAGGDLDGDGVTDADDLGILLGVFGGVCE